MKITLLNITVSTDNNRDDNNKRNIRRSLECDGKSWLHAWANISKQFIREIIPRRRWLISVSLTFRRSDGVINRLSVIDWQESFSHGEIIKRTVLGTERKRRNLWKKLKTVSKLLVVDDRNVFSLQIKTLAAYQWDERRDKRKRKKMGKRKELRRAKRQKRSGNLCDSETNVALIKGNSKRFLVKAARRLQRKGRSNGSVWSDAEFDYYGVPHETYSTSTWHAANP